MTLTGIWEVKMILVIAMMRNYLCGLIGYIPWTIWLIVPENIILSNNQKFRKLGSESNKLDRLLRLSRINGTTLGNIKLVKKAIVILLGTAGIVLRNMTPGRWLAIGLSCIPVYFLFQYPSLKLGIGYWLVSMILHYTVLFGTFVKGGFKEYWLATGKTKEDAHKKFEAWLSFAFFHNGLAFSYLYFTSMNEQAFTFVPIFWTMSLGITLQVAGFIIKFLAAWQIGLEIYYYKDMFIEEKVIDFESDGIFKYMSNPLYSFGQLNGYGAALYVFSLYGLAAVLINQLCFYCFYYTLEKPFVKRFYAPFAFVVK